MGRALRVGLVGCGFIGSNLAKAIQQRFRGKARLIGLYDHNLEKARSLRRRLRPSVPVLSPDVLLRNSKLLIEAASAQAVGEWLPRAIRRRTPMLILSTGGLLRNPGLLKRAAARKVPVYLPSGAIAGLDGIKAARIGALRSVTLTTRKPPRALGLKTLRAPQTLFEGPASRAVAKFPQNINVAATLALAGLGARKTRVRIVADPSARRNIHEIEAEGNFGRLRVRVENVPAPENPKTSALAVLSAVAALDRILKPLQIGT